MTSGPNLRKFGWKLTMCKFSSRIVTKNEKIMYSEVIWKLFSSGLNSWLFLFLVQFGHAGVCLLSIHLNLPDCTSRSRFRQDCSHLCFLNVRSALVVSAATNLVENLQSVNNQLTHQVIVFNIYILPFFLIIVTMLSALILVMFCLY